MYFRKKETNIERIISQKTASVFEAAALAGWCIGSGQSLDTSETQLLRQAAHDYGVAFQLADDLDDHDIQMAYGHINYAVIHGKKATHKEIQKHLSQSKEKLTELGLWSQLWKDAHKCILN